MRSIALLAVVTGALALAYGCGDSGSGTQPPENTGPVADFALPSCSVNVPCGFTSTSTDDHAVTEWSWDFNGDGTPDATTGNASFTYTAAGSFNVGLTVRDAGGLSNTKTASITIAPPGVNTPPTAGFTYSCDAGTCSFTSTSTDVAPGTITTYHWSFGDAGTADVADPVHAYAVTVPQTYTVSLTVTDNEGASDSESQTISVSPPVAGAEGCVTDGFIVKCALDVTARATMKVKLLTVDCDRSLESTRLIAPPPISDKVFLHVCGQPVGAEIGIYGGVKDTLLVYEPGSQVLLWFKQGTPDGNHTPLAPPAGRVEGTFPDWTLYFDDGNNPTGAGEPDMNDLIAGVHATLK